MAGFVFLLLIFISFTREIECLEIPEILVTLLQQRAICSLVIVLQFSPKQVQSASGLHGIRMLYLDLG